MVIAGLLGASIASASPAEERKKLLEKLGIDRANPKPEPEPEPEPDDEAEPDDDSEPSDPSDPSDPADDEPGVETPAAEAEPKTTYRGKIHRLLQSGCASCHKKGESAGNTKLVLSGSIASDYKAARKFVAKGRPDSSSLLTKAAGKQHGGGAPFAAGSSKYNALRKWIEDGAPKGGGGGTAPVVTAPVVTPPVATPTEAPATPRTSKPKPKPKPKPSGAAKPATAPVETTPAKETPAVQASADPEPADTTPLPPKPRAFAPGSHAVLLAKCQGCHKQGLPAGANYALSGNVTADYWASFNRVDAGDPEGSLLLTKAAGTQHGGGPTIKDDSSEYATLIAWIADGAAGPTEADIPAPDPSPVAEDGTAAESVMVDATSGASPPPSGDRLGDGTALGPAVQTPSRLPFGMPKHLYINGKFDFSYERRNFKGQPFGPGDNQFRTYHHFLFLSRAGADDPFGFNVELITRAFFEFNARVAPTGKRYAFLFKAGKILVPFGPEPLFHKSYGGRSGFDQEILPLVWAQPGVAANTHVRVGPVALSNDLYSVQGYALRDEEALLNLQGDTSDLETFRAAFGDRLGVSWGPLTGWYSVQLNYLGFSRLLAMQALDFEVWRPTDVPVVRDFVLGLGALRADVSGGGPGLDYYHFGSYGSVGYYPLEWLYLQYRAGLKTVDNRAGAFFDDRRVDERDRGSHNLSITARYKGLYGGLQWFWNLERANEQDDDFMRITVGYEF